MNTQQQIHDFGNDIQTLPTDNNPITVNDRKILDTFFTASPSSNLIFNEFKDVITTGFIFFLISLPQSDELISKFLTYNSPYILLLVKTCIFMTIVYLCKNISITKKQ